MRKLSVFVLGLLAAALAAAAWAQVVLPRDVRLRLLEAVVEVAPYDDAAGRLTGSGGSGTVISPEGHVLTNFHVIGDMESGFAHEWHAIYVTDPLSPDKQTEHRYWARFVAGDPSLDLAILKIEEYADETPLPPGFVFATAAVGDSNTLLPGDPITVIGYPGIGGFTVTVTTGIVSGWLGEDLASGGKRWVKTDARIAGGNSGGGAFDELGNLVAVPTSRVQTREGAFEEQNLLRPVALALPLIAVHVPNAVRSGGVSTIAAAPSLAPVRPPVGAIDPLPPTGVRDETIYGELADGDTTLDSGEFFDVHERTLPAGVTVAISLTSSAFDPYFGLLDPDGNVVMEVDDSEGAELNVLETFVPDRAGTYRFVVTSAFPGERGAYELRIAPGVATPSTTVVGPPPGTSTPRNDPFAVTPVVSAATSSRALDPSSGTVGAVPIGARVAGRLAGSREVTYHTYLVEVPAGTRRVSFVMIADVDLDLFVKFGSDIADWGEGGDWTLRDIDTAASATLTVEDPRPGTWYVDVVFYQGGSATASYSFEVR